MITVTKSPILSEQLVEQKIKMIADKMSGKQNANNGYIAHINFAKESSVPVAGMSINDAKLFDKLSEKLCELYSHMAPDSRLNPYLTQKEKQIATNKANTDFMQAFMDGTKDTFEPITAINLGNKVMDMVNSKLDNYAGKFLHSKQCKEYVDNASKIEDINVAMNREEEILNEYKDKLTDLKNKYDKEINKDRKNALAKEYNSTADEYNKHVNEYNRLLLQLYTPIVREQRELARIITNTMRQGNKDAFKFLLGGIPKLPQGIYK